MLIPQRVLIALIAMILALLGPPAQGQERRPEPEKPPHGIVQARNVTVGLLPEKLLGILVVNEPDKQLGELRQWLETPAVRELPIYERLVNAPQFAQAKIGLYGLAGAAGSEPWSALQAFVGREAAIGIYSGEKDEPGWVVVVQTREPALLEKLVEGAHALAGLTKDGKPDEARSFVLGEARVFTTGPREFHSLMGDVFIISNQRDLIEQAVKLKGGGEHWIFNSPAFQATVAKVGRNPRAWGYVDMKAVRGQKTWAEKLDNPFLAFVGGGWAAAARSADVAMMWLDWKERTLTVNVRSEAEGARPAGLAAFAWKPERGPGWEAAKLPRFMGEWQITRDWAELFSQREVLLEPGAASQLVNVANTATTLMGGMNFADEFLENVAGPVRLVAARQEFAADATPTPKLPGFALMTPLKRHDEAFAAKLNSAALTAISIINVDAGQKGNPTFLIDTEMYKGCRIVSGKYAKEGNEGMRERGNEEEKSASKSAEREKERAPYGQAAMTPAGKEGLGIRYNFSPAIAVVEDEFVIATSPALMHDIIDLREKGARPTVKVEAGRDLLDIDAREVNKLLRENLKELVANQMLEKDLPREKATENIEMFLSLLDLLRGADVRVTPFELGGKWGYDGRIDLQFGEVK